MSDVFLLSSRQLHRIRPYFPLSHGVPRVDDLRVVSGIIYVTKPFGIIASIAEQGFRLWQGVDQQGCAFEVAYLSGAKEQTHGSAVLVGDGVPFGV